MLSQVVILFMFSVKGHAASVDAKISETTVSYYNSRVNSCSKYSENKGLADSHMQAMKDGIQQQKDLSSYVISEYKKIFQDFYGCDASFISTFGKKLAEDNREFHIHKRAQLKKDLIEFEKRGLVGTTILSDHSQYAERNDIDLPPDPEMDAIFNKKKKAIEKRKESCTDVMNLKPPLSIHEPRNQQGIGWCYAYTAADLISNVLGKKVSAVYVAGLYNDMFMNRFWGVTEGGNPFLAANEVLEHGVCLEKDLPSNDYQFINMQNDIGTLFNSFNELGVKYSAKKEITSMLDKKPSSYANSYSRQQVYADLCTQQQDILIQLSQVFPRLTLDQLAIVLMKSGNHSFSELVKKCPIEESPELKNITFKSVTNKDKKKNMYSIMDQQLSEGNIVGIGYTSEALLDYKADQMKKNHASSVIGRRFNDKTMSCEYMVRNAWGKDCSSYAKNVECVDGHAWINEETFKYNNALFEVDYVEKK